MSQLDHPRTASKQAVSLIKNLTNADNDNSMNMSTLCVVGVDAGNAVTPSTGLPTSDGVLYILHMGGGTIPTMRNNWFTENRQSVNKTLILDIWGHVYKNWGHMGPLNCTL